MLFSHRFGTPPSPTLRQRRLAHNRIRAGWLVLGALFLLGCGQSPMPTPGTRLASDSPKSASPAAATSPAKKTASSQSAAAAAPAAKAQNPQTTPPPLPRAKAAGTEGMSIAEWNERAEDGKPVSDFWDAYFIQGSQVGYAHTKVWNIQEQGKQRIKTRTDSQMTIKRLGQTIVQKMILESVEEHDGNLVRCRSHVSAGSGEMQMDAEVVDQKLNIVTKSLGKSSKSQVAWPTGGGFFVADQSLQTAPMKPGEKRSVQGLLPLINQSGQTDLEAIDYETVDLLDGKKELLKVKTKISLGGGEIETTLWVDDKGNPLKSVVSGIQQETYRTTKERATKKPEAGGADLDLMVASVVPVKGKLAGLTSGRRVTYIARLKQGKIDGLLAPGLGQLLQPAKENAAKFEVRVVNPQIPRTLDTTQNEPTEKDLAANNYLQAEDPLVKKLAAELGPSTQDPWKLAIAAEKLVHSKIRRKDFSQAFATAAEVARDLEGDCTEHAVLLAAVCRAQKIPARVCIGLVYVPNLKGFAFHAWNEIWVRDRWIPLDATLGRGFVPPDHVKLADTNLEGGNAFTAVLPVVRAMGQLELEVVSVD